MACKVFFPVAICVFESPKCYLCARSILLTMCPARTAVILRRCSATGGTIISTNSPLQIAPVAGRCCALINRQRFHWPFSAKFLILVYHASLMSNSALWWETMLRKLAITSTLSCPRPVARILEICDKRAMQRYSTTIFE